MFGEIVMFLKREGEMSCMSLKWVGQQASRDHMDESFVAFSACFISMAIWVFLM